MKKIRNITFVLVCLLMIPLIFAACGSNQKEVPDAVIQDLVDMNEYIDQGDYTVAVTHYPDKATHRDSVDIVLSVRTPYVDIVSTCSAVYEYNRSTDLWSLIKYDGWTRPYYAANDNLVGTWEDLSYDLGYYEIDVSFDGITFRVTDGFEEQSYGPLAYDISVDSRYTYLEFYMDDGPAVLILINEDMAALCWGEESDYTGYTPNGVMFDADMWSWCYKKGAGKTTLPASIPADIVNAIHEEVGTEYYYYENAQVIATPNYWGFPALAITEDGMLSGMEAITLIGYGYGYETRAAGNFLITDAT